MHSMVQIKLSGPYDSDADANDKGLRNHDFAMDGTVRDCNCPQKVLNVAIPT